MKLDDLDATMRRLAINSVVLSIDTKSNAYISAFFQQEGQRMKCERQLAATSTEALGLIMSRVDDEDLLI